MRYLGSQSGQFWINLPRRRWQRKLWWLTVCFYVSSSDLYAQIVFNKCNLEGSTFASHPQETSRSIHPIRYHGTRQLFCSCRFWICTWQVWRFLHLLGIPWDVYFGNHYARLNNCNVISHLSDAGGTLRFLSLIPTIVDEVLYLIFV